MNSKVILHISNDEKFIDYAIENFSSSEIDFPHINHIFFVISESENVKLIKHKEKIKVFNKMGIIKYLCFNRRNSFDAVVFHSFTGFFILLSKIIRSSIVRVWIGWGFDYYQLINEISKTEKKKKFKNKLKVILNARREYKRIDIFSPVLLSEYESLRKFFSPDVKVIDWNYGSQVSFFNDLKKKNSLDNISLGRHIIIGNSATSSNNHFDILNRLVGCKEKIILPLSYGDNKYRDSLIEHLNKSEFEYVALLDFLSKDDYFKMLSSCHVMVMNHERQQGAGNISLALMLGLTVYMNAQSPLFSYYKECGFYIFDINQIKLGSELVVLDSAAIEKNKTLARDIFNEEVTKIKTNELVNQIYKKIERLG